MIYKKNFHSFSVDVFSSTEEEPTGRLIRGRMLIDPIESRCTFVQNEKRGQRSVEVLRTAHGRMVRRPDGMYTLTLRFDASEKYIRETLLAEVRSFASEADFDREYQRLHKKILNNE